MNAYIANTDYDWYRYLSAQADLDEVNFWRTGGGGAFRALRTGEPFFFKLKTERDHGRPRNSWTTIRRRFSGRDALSHEVGRHGR